MLTTDTFDRSIVITIDCIFSGEFPQDDQFSVECECADELFNVNMVTPSIPIAGEFRMFRSVFEAMQYYIRVSH